VKKKRKAAPANVLVIYIPFGQERLAMRGKPRELNPIRPPKRWFDKTVKALKQRREITDPEAVAGWIWFHRLTPTMRQVILKSEGVKATKKDVTW